jgi:predicted transcriptional regulator of viral defense system
MNYIKTQDLIDEMSNHNKLVFTLNDATKYMNKPRKYVSKQLASNKKVVRIERGKYFISYGKGIDLYAVASQILYPSYISLLSAFQYYSVTTQVTNAYSVISLKRHRTIVFDDNIIEFRTVKKERFFGYKRVQNTFISLLEKAIIDSIYLGTPAFSYVEEAFSSAIERGILDIDRLKSFANRMNSKTVSGKVSQLIGNKHGNGIIRGEIK